MKNKKKGFTLIELIAVIAILAILGAVLVPKIIGYQNKAKKSNFQTSAKTIVHAIQAYNADATTPISGSFTAAAVSSINENGVIIKADDTYVAALTGKSLDDLAKIAAGNFTLNNDGKSIKAVSGTDTFSN